MAIITSPYSASFRDAKGWIKVYRYFVTSNTSDATAPADLVALLTGLQNAIAALTTATLYRSFSGSILPNPTLTYPSAAPYTANWMEARMMFEDDEHTVHRFGIGAPLLNIFDSDQVTVLNDGTQANVVAYVAAVKANAHNSFVSTASGLAFTHFVGGLLKVGRQPKRFNETIRSSHLVQGEGE